MKTPLAPNEGAGAPEITITLTAETIQLGGRILSRLQGCEDPLGQRKYYEELFTDLVDGLLKKGSAVRALSQTVRADS
jgi:hypothetical protein